MSKITIKITNLEITIETDAAPTISGADNPLVFDPTKLAETLTSLTLPPPPAAAPVAMPAPPKRKARTVTPEPQRAQISPEPQVAPAAVPAPTDTAVYLNGHTPTEPPKKRLHFEEFDRQVRAEMKRLAPSPGMMPGHTLWNDQRAPYLPTMGGVVSRYDCTSLVELAKALGLNPPLGKPGPVKATTNGVAA